MLFIVLLLLHGLLKRLIKILKFPLEKKIEYSCLLFLLRYFFPILKLSILISLPFPLRFEFDV